MRACGQELVCAAVTAQATVADHASAAMIPAVGNALSKDWVPYPTPTSAYSHASVPASRSEDATGPTLLLLTDASGRLPTAFKAGQPLSWFERTAPRPATAGRPARNTPCRGAVINLPDISILSDRTRLHLGRSTRETKLASHRPGQQLEESGQVHRASANVECDRQSETAGSCIIRLHTCRRVRTHPSPLCYRASHLLPRSWSLAPPLPACS